MKIEAGTVINTKVAVRKKVLCHWMNYGGGSRFRQLHYDQYFDFQFLFRYHSLEYADYVCFGVFVYDALKCVSFPIAP